MKMKFSKSNSREGKKQLVAYVNDDFATLVHNYAEKNDKTIQEVLAEAVNQFYLSKGNNPILPVGHIRMFHRRIGVSKIRNSSPAKSRKGKRSIVAYYDSEKVLEVQKFSRSNKISFHEIFKQGFKML
jgi:dihydroxyacetone kinase